MWCAMSLFLSLFLTQAVFNFKKIFIYLFIFGHVGSSLLRGTFLKLRWAGAALWLQCSDFSLAAASLAWASVVAACGSALVAHGLRCPVACGIFPDQRSNWCPLTCKTDSYPLNYQGRPLYTVLNKSHHVHKSVQYQWVCGPCCAGHCVKPEATRRPLSYLTSKKTEEWADI